MPTVLGPRLPRDFAGLPAHMSAEDYSIWDRWRRTLPGDVLGLYFDVRLGSGRAAGDVTDPALRRMWFDVTAKRADVVVELATSVWIVELREAAQSSAIGRLQMYARLWRDDPVIAKPLGLVLVTNQSDPDVAVLAADLGVRYVVI